MSPQDAPDVHDVPGHGRVGGVDDPVPREEYGDVQEEPRSSRRRGEVVVETDRPGVVAAALREAVEQYRRDVDDPRVDVDRADLAHLRDLANEIEDGGRE